MLQVRRVLAVLVAVVVGSCLLAAGAQAQSATLYVDNTNPAATDTGNDCQTQSTPCLTISHAASEAEGLTSTDATIVVVAGSYDEAITLEEPSGSTLTITGGPGVTVTAPAGDSIFTSSYPTGKITLSHLTITGATASGNGGAVEDNSAAVNLIDDTFSNDSASSGGALDTQGGNVIVGDTFVGDSSKGDGGAISNNGTISSIYDDTFANNKAGGDGGAIVTETGATIQNSTFVGNQASSGGAIFNYYDAAIANDIFDDGTAAGANCVDDPLNGGAGITDVGYNVADNADCGMSTSNHDQVNAPETGTGGINLGALQDNGGPTETAAIGSDSAAYHLVLVPNCAPLSLKAGPQVDQRGVPRPQPPSSGSCDAGAYEYAPPAVTKVSPSSGEAGATVTITGYGFTLADAVKFGASSAAGYTIDSDKQITVPAPAGSGTVDITVINPDGTSPTGSADQFTYGTTTAPAITSADGTTFTVGQRGSFAVQTSGSPTPSLSESGSLPGGVTFVDNGDGTATLSGKPAAGSGGSYPIQITASNGVSPDAIQNFTLTVHQPPAITSHKTATFTVGHSGSFTVQTSGSPTPSLSESGSLPGGVTFVDNGDGTASLSGKPAAGSGGSYPIQIKAANGVSPAAIQNFTLTVIGPPGVKISKADISSTHHEATFTFKAVGSATGFQCALGKQGSKPHFASCTSPKTYKNLKAGKYTFEVRAVNAAGHGSAAKKSFTIA